MKQIIVLHGTGETAESFWMPYIKQQLEKRKHSVSIPKLPNTNNPILSEQLEYVIKNEIFTKDTILIGHSSGCPLILAVLEKTQIKVKKTIFVAGYSFPLKSVPHDTKNIKEFYDWTRIKEHCKEFIFINGINDPWGANDQQGKFMFDKLGGTLIINNDGHMGSEKYHQPYPGFPLLLSLILLPSIKR